LHLKAAKLQRLRHKNANTENRQWPGFLLLFSHLVNFLSMKVIPTFVIKQDIINSLNF